MRTAIFILKGKVKGRNSVDYFLPFFVLFYPTNLASTNFSTNFHPTNYFREPLFVDKFILGMRFYLLRNRSNFCCRVPMLAAVIIPAVSVLYLTVFSSGIGLSEAIMT